MIMINDELAYKAMFRFLEKYYELTQADDVGALLGSMSMAVFADGRPADAAMWAEWQSAVRMVIAEQDGATAVAE
jgi:hypothetical protein